MKYNARQMMRKQEEQRLHIQSYKDALRAVNEATVFLLDRHLEWTEADVATYNQAALNAANKGLELARIIPPKMVYEIIQEVQKEFKEQS
jgi:hypothetical protein